MADINDKYVIYYATKGYGSSLTVTISVYDTIGSAEVDAQTMTELGTTGIYYYNWFPKKRTTYTAIMNCTERPYKSHQIIRIKKTKLAGAISIPKVKQVFTDKVKDNFLKKFLDLSSKQEKCNQEILKIKDSVTYKKQISELHSKELIHSVDESLEIHLQNITKITDESIKKLKIPYNDFQTILEDFNVIQKNFTNLTSKIMKSNISKEVNNLTETFRKESNKFTSKELFSKLDQLSGNLVKIISVTDEAIATSSLSTELFNVNFKKKLENLSQGVDELALLLKNQIFTPDFKKNFEILSEGIEIILPIIENAKRP